MSKNLKCNLKLHHCKSIPVFLEQNHPNAIYRYFDREKDMDEFLDGNIRFSGPSTNRFCFNKLDDLANDELRLNDVFEYKNAIASFNGEYSLSFSKEIIKPYLYNIKITNISGFLFDIIESIRDVTLNHSVSWHSIEKLALEQEMLLMKIK
ncbi:MAG: hypothetical protein NTU49_03795 [Gammaproteobacteria bacterium]|nr:hypothetical protein [Gammaproteobacteria bacterium]